MSVRRLTLRQGVIPWHSSDMLWTILAGLAVSSLVQAALISTLRRENVPRLLVAWYVAPFIMLGLVILISVASGPPTEKPLDNAIFGFMLIASVGVIPWTISFAAGLALGAVLRRILKGREEPNEAMPRTSLELNESHVGVAGDGLKVNGIDVWKHPWKPTNLADIQRAHPAHPHQRHWFSVYEIGEGRRSAVFLAGELSNGVWGFYPWHGERPLASSAISGAGRPAYKAMVVIALLAFLFIGVLTYLVETTRPSPKPQLTPLPVMPAEVAAGA